jgi:hypothetical protein
VLLPNEPVLRIGVIGLAIVVGLNILGHFALHQPAAVIFTDAWLNAWGPVYVVFLVISVVGVVKHLKHSMGASK